MKKILFEKEYNVKIVSSVVLDDTLTLNLEDGRAISLESYHESDCCENVYADFGVARHFMGEVDGKFLAKLVIKGVEELGFLLCFFDSIYSQVGKKLFIPCYNSQNGYYSSNLALVIREGETEIKINLHGFVEANID